ncbi:MAG: hypothetical protein JSW40_03825 [Candidatus Omnitrophota bacterium]|nr:MAG: hypothetical protein JSW40_03825 [Candidatus Omnitrophota bacterium]
MNASTRKVREAEQVVIVIQARMSSSRFPGKMMTKLSGMPLVEYVYRRCERSSLGRVVVATSDDISDDALYDYCKNNDIFVMRGSLHNVLERYIQVADSLNAEYIVRVCADTPLVDISLMRVLLKVLIEEKLDFASLDGQTCASGFLSEVIATQTLKKVVGLTHVAEDLEHVTRFIIKNEKSFSVKRIKADLNPEFIRDIRLTIDYPEDIKKVSAIIDALSDKFLFTSEEVLEVVRRKGLQ